MFSYLHPTFAFQCRSFECQRPAPIHKMRRWKACAGNYIELKDYKRLLRTLTTLLHQPAGGLCTVSRPGSDYCHFLDVALLKITRPQRTYSCQNIEYTSVACHATTQRSWLLQLSDRRLSTGGVSRKDYLWGISGRSHRVKADSDESNDCSRSDEPKSSVPDDKCSADLEEQALERAVLEAYRLLQEGKVESAEYLVIEALRSAESLLAEDDPWIAQLCDQVALLQFFQGRFKDAEKHAKRSLAASQQLPENEAKAPAVALCGLRLGAITLGLERKAEAVAMLEAAHETLLAAFGEEYEPVSEAIFYLTLARLPLALNPEALQSVEERMTLALRQMSGSPGVGVHLMRAGLREHRALMDRAVCAEDWILAESILHQAIRILQEVCPGSDELALTTYQYGTLQYVRGLHTHAEALCAESLALAQHLYHKDSSSQVALRLHRLGTLHLAEGRTSQALQALEKSCKTLTHNVGDGNPLAGESRAALAMARLSQVNDSHTSTDPYTRVLIPGRRQQLLAEIEAGLAVMQRGFGAEHMLVRKMRQLNNQIVGS